MNRISKSQLEDGPVRVEVDGVQAVVMSLSDYEDLLDTSDPAVRGRIAESHQDYLSGKVRPLDELLGELDGDDE